MARMRSVGVRAQLAWLVGLAAAGLLLTGGSASAMVDRARTGDWSEVFDWDFIPIHASVLDDGRVLTYGGTAGGGQGGFELDVWDPSAGSGNGAHTTIANNLGTNLFCSFTLDDPNQDRKLLLGGQRVGNRVPNFTSQFAAGNLTDFTSMNNPRWYPTATTLWDGRVLVQGGVPGSFDDRSNPVRVAEVHSEGSGWRNLEGTRNAGVWDTPNYGWWYPKSHVTPSGRVWNLAWDKMFYLDPDGAGSVTDLGTFPTDNRGGSSASVMFDTGLVLQVGGGERGSDDTRFIGSNKATVVDLNYEPPRLRPVSPMANRRHWADAIVLADGKVLVVGGSQVNNTNSGVALAPELWDPETDTWTELAANAIPRLYHSTALLLADGSIFTGGGGAPGPQNNLNAEVFHPPYLFGADGERATRPTITSSPSTMRYATTFTATADTTVDRVTLIKTGNATHSMSTQIFQELEFTQVGNRLDIEAPDYATVATPGQYMLFVIDQAGVPSVAKQLRLTGTGLTPPPPRSDQEIGGTVEDRDGSAVEQLKVDLFTENRSSFLGFTRTDADGRYRFAVSPGCYVLTFIAPPDETFVNGGRFQNRSVCVEQGQVITTVGATVDRGGGSATSGGGTVRSADGTAAPGVKVDLFTENRATFLGFTTTDSSGRYRFDLPSSGCYVHTFIAPQGQQFESSGTRFLNRAYCVGAGQSADSIDATLAGPVNNDSVIGGRVSAANGGAVNGLKTNLFTAGADGRRQSFVGPASTGADGRYRYDAAPGCYVVVFIGVGGQTFAESGGRFYEARLCVAAGETNDQINATLN